MRIFRDFDARHVRASGETAHLTTAKINAKAVVQDVVDAVNPVNNVIAAAKGLDDLRGFAILLAPWIMIRVIAAFFMEVLDVLLLPFRLLKDLGETIYHLFAAIGQKTPAEAELDGEDDLLYLVTPERRMLDNAFDDTDPRPVAKASRTVPMLALQVPASAGVRT